MDKPIRKKGWYRVGEDIPSGMYCSLCDRVGRDGEVMYGWSVMCAPMKAIDVPHRHITVIHKTCMNHVMQQAPMDTYDTIRERITTGGSLFNE